MNQRQEDGTAVGEFDYETGRERGKAVRLEHDPEQNSVCVSEITDPAARIAETVHPESQSAKQADEQASPFKPPGI